MFRKKYNPAEISKINSEGYSLYFDDLDSAKKSFDKFDMISDGHHWERAIDYYCMDNNIDISKIDFDSESDLFAAYSNDKESLKIVTSIIDKFIQQPKTLNDVLKNIEDEDDECFTPSEFIEHLEDNGFNLSEKINIIFYVDFNDEKQAKEACELASVNGYTCLLGIEYDNSPIAASIEMIPNKNNIEKSYKFFMEIANNLNGKLDDYTFDDLSEIAELDHWVLFNK